MSAGYELVDHPDDIGVHAWGATPADVFEQSARALFSLVCDPLEIGEAESIEVELEAERMDLLLAAWLNELLDIFEVRRVLPAHFEVLELDSRSLRARVTGEGVGAERQMVCGGVKEATLHKLALEPRDGGWEGFVLLEV